MINVNDSIKAGTNVSITGNDTTTTLYVINANAGFTHYIGELYGGGIVVAVWKIKVNGVDEEHGLITNTEGNIMDANSVELLRYSSVGIITSSFPYDGKNNFDGSYNTTAIIQQDPADTNNAAHLCQFSDWYLPSVFELKQINNSIFIINSIMSVGTGFKLNNKYWSSTQLGAADAYAVDFTIGNTFGNIISMSKTNTAYVRAVRRY